MSIEDRKFSIAWPVELKDQEDLRIPGPRMVDILWYDVTGKEQIVGQIFRLNGAEYTVKILGMQVGAGAVSSEVMPHQEPQEGESVYALVGLGEMRVSRTLEGLEEEPAYPLMGPLTYKELAEASFEFGVVNTGIRGKQEQLVLLAHTSKRTVAIQPVTTPKEYCHQTKISSAQDSTSLCWMCLKLTPYDY